MSVAWPTADSFPQGILINGYSESQEPQTVGTDMAAGPTKIRRRFTAYSTLVQGSILVNETQKADFWTWYNTDLLGGSLSFTWVHPTTGAAVTMQFDPTAIPQVSPVSYDKYLIQMSLQILP